MTEDGAPIRLREAGVGVVVGGIVLILLAAGIDPLIGAVGTIVAGFAYVFAGPDLIDRRRVGLGIALVGMIGLIEVSRFGIGFGPLEIGLFAVAFGMLDVTIGLVLSRVRYRRSNGD